MMMMNSYMKNNRGSGPLSLRSLNHISRVCRCIEHSIQFYEDILGFVSIKRPGSFHFDGAWLFNYGIGIHLLQSPDPENLPEKTEINPRDHHVSFQAEDVEIVERKLKDMKIKYVKRILEDSGIFVDQLFIHDPDGFMIEICNCENIPVEPINTVGYASCRLPPAIDKKREVIHTEIQSTMADQMKDVGASPLLF